MHIVYICIVPVYTPEAKLHRITQIQTAWYIWMISLLFETQTFRSDFRIKQFYRVLKFQTR